MNRELELQRLAKAEEDVQSSRKHIARQLELIEELRRDGHSVILAEQVLRTLQGCLASQQRHVDLLAREIAQEPADSRLSQSARMAIAESRRQLIVNQPPSRSK
jgi:hypothetical protein